MSRFMIALLLLALLAFTAPLPAQPPAQKWVVSWISSVHGPYPSGNPSAQPDMKLAGPHYYLHSAPFIAKVSLFALVALLSIYPTVVFLSWRPSLRLGQPPLPDARKIRRVRSLIHWELAAVVVLILCAALMAKGIGVLV